MYIIIIVVYWWKQFIYVDWKKEERERERYLGYAICCYRWFFEQMDKWRISSNVFTLSKCALKSSCIYSIKFVYWGYDWEVSTPKLIWSTKPEVHNLMPKDLLQCVLMLYYLWTKKWHCMIQIQDGIQKNQNMDYLKPLALGSVELSWWFNNYFHVLFF